MTQVIYALGNPLLKEDSLPLKILPKLRERFKGVVFKELDPSENLPEEEHLVIVDTIINCNNVCVLKDIDKIATEPRYSLHDFDLGFSLKLMKKLGKINDVTIIGVPQMIRLENALEQTVKIIASLLSESARRN